VRHAYGEFGRTEHLDYVLHEEGHIILWERANEFLDKDLK